VNEQEPETTETDAEAVEAAPPEVEEVVAPEQREEAPARAERRRPRYISRRKVCFFCAEKVADISYKNADTLRRYLSDRGKIEPRRKTGTCAKHQRRLTLALKHARHLALLPYTADHIRVTGPFPSRG
jgi:small subunit ribosomal protein S18